MTEERPRVIVTTDMEVDDMNSVVHLALHLNELDVAAFVYTASQYHFQGDGSHTLAEANPHWRTKGKRAYEWPVVPHEPDPEAGALTSYRPFPEGWMERLWLGPYAEAWPHLCENGGRYPTPEELVERTYVGNVAFEGDVREETPGSNAIRDAILDDDPRTLWLLSWGGMNTIVRALMSVAERYAGTPEWDDVRDRVRRKVRVMGVADGIGQDNSWLDHGRALFPELTLWRVPFIYGGYVDAKFAQEDSIELFRAPWPEENLVRGNGPLMGAYKLYGDGRHYEGEPERFQFGEHATLDWGFEGMAPLVFSHGDFMAEGDSMTFMPLLPLGLRGADDPRFSTVLGPLFRDGEPSSVPSAAPFETPQGNPNPYLRAYQEEFAARAQWCTHGYDECNHAPVIEAVTPDLEARAGETVSLSARASDPDGDDLLPRWRYDALASTYRGEGLALLEAWEARSLDATLRVPHDARPGDRLVLTLSVRDVAERPMTRYAQVLITVA